MNFFKKGFFKFYVLISIFLFLFALESQFDLIKVKPFFVKFGYEFHPVEISQVIILLYIFILHVRNKKILEKNSCKLAYFFRLGFISLIFYEELSFISQFIFTVSNKINVQNELSIHNLSFLAQNYLKLGNSNFNYFELDISFEKLFYFAILFFISFGSNSSLFKKFKVFFLEKKFAFFSIIYFIDQMFLSISFNSKTILDGRTLIGHELMELIFYVILLLDTIDKKSKNISSR